MASPFLKGGNCSSNQQQNNRGLSPITLAGRPSGDIEAILGYVDEPELIHRDNLILLG
jgi:hypothetical protein